MSCRNHGKKAFTLVELLVVIGIIALLIAILMPALSRARKQALQASCGSNERQVAYAMLSYANDWKESLPTRWGYHQSMYCGCPVEGLHCLVRLPIIGFDTATIWDWWTYSLTGYFGPGSVMLGGAGFVMRDYLKNDFDIYVCPDGWYSRNNMLGKWNGQTEAWGGYWGPHNFRSQDTNEGLYTYMTGYQWLPHRALAYNPGDTRVCGTHTLTDQPNEIARSASAKPDLLLLADFNIYMDRTVADCPGRPTSNCGIGANHNATDNRQLPIKDSNCLSPLVPPDLVRESNPEDMPLGMNRARIDARTTWLAFQDWNHYKWSAYYQFYSF